MGQQADTSLTTGSRGARGQKRPRMRNDASDGVLKNSAVSRQRMGSKQLQSQQQRQARQAARKGQHGNPRPGTAAPTGTASPTTPATPSTPTGAPSGTGGTPPDLATQLQPYTAPLPPIIKAYMDKLSAGQVNAPTFQDMFTQYQDIAARETDRQAAAIGESMGGYGGRYSSAALGQESAMRQQMGEETAYMGSQIQQELEKQQFTELSGVGGLAYASGEAGMDRYWQDFLRQTSPPPFVGMAADLSAGYGLPPTVFQ